MTINWCTFAPLIFALIAILIGLAYKQYKPAVNAFAIAYYWCVVLAVIWVLLSMFVFGHVVTR